MQVDVVALDRLLELALLVNADMDAGLAARGLTPSRTHLLWVLHQHGPATQRELADALEIAPRSVTGLVDALEDSGHVVRRPHENDRRAVRVHLTPKAVEAMARMEQERDELARALFGPVPRRRLTALVTELEELSARLRRLMEEAGP